MNIRLKHETQEELTNIRNEISHRSFLVRDRRVYIGQKEKYSYREPGFMLLTKETEELKIDWDSLLGSFHELERIDLKLVPLESQHLPLLLRAAGKHCVQLEALILPRKPDWKKPAKGKK
ncbi:hypothetical protein GN244_ATG08936 [Phytophthora infestans]|uniref:Uncharacterized protein n=1 Tax=Phytophthora infestans TaxID=4787 RepID=A0A833SUQ6_PHYIN|nr:hypothetical protein GN244_ATG08936 [Phytophthora infestans]KAF4127475.1 hypothetical protein GN958_ATG23350 [Phytophthora infestans]KAI9995991.1 hypothetical protein PInf_013169 [Phytophthora infestans]